MDLSSNLLSHSMGFFPFWRDKKKTWTMKLEYEVGMFEFGESEEEYGYEI